MRTTPFIVHSIMWLAFLIIGCIQLAKTQLISASGAIGMGVIFYRYCLLHVQQFQWQWLKPILIVQICCSVILWIVALYVL